MIETRAAFEQMTDTARLALGRGDRSAAQATLSAALQGADAMNLVRSETADALIRLGTLYQDAGLNADAERLFAEALVAAERAAGPDNWTLVAPLASLGSALIGRGANSDAEPLLTRALAISEAHFGPEHAELNVLLNALSRLYLKEGAFARAEPLLERLLVLKRSKGEDHPEVATILASLAAVRQGLGDHEAAEVLARKVLRIRERTLAPNHFAVASSLELLADSCAARGKLGEALHLYKRALSIREQTLGVSHTSLRVARERIADLQLQAAEGSLGDGSDDGSAMMPTGATYAPMAAANAPIAAAHVPIAAAHVPITAAYVPMPRTLPPTPGPVAPGPVALPADAALSLPAALSVASMNESIRERLSAIRLEEPVALTTTGGEEGLQRALVLPGFDGMLSLRDELKTLEEQLDEQTAAESHSNGLRALAISAWTAISGRPVQAAIVGTSALALLLAAVITQPHAAEDNTAPQRVADAPAQRSLSATGSSNNAESPVTATSNGSLALHNVATPSIAHASAQSRPSTSNTEKPASQGSEGLGSLELGHQVRAALPNIVVQGADSALRVSEFGPKPVADQFSKQFWTAQSDKKASTEPAAAPTRARIQGTLPQPAYPEFLRKNGVEGEVVVQFLVDETGRPDLSSLEVVRSPHDALTDAVKKAVDQIHFDPALTGGPSPKPRSEVVRISYVFKATK